MFVALYTSVCAQWAGECLCSVFQTVVTSCTFCSDEVPLGEVKPQLVKLE